MFLRLLLGLGLVALGLAAATDRSGYEEQHNEVELNIPEGQYGFPYYTGYPFYHSGYPFYHGAFPYHYPGNFPPYYPYYAPVVPPQTADPYGSSYVYHGSFDGHCSADGLYYVDRRSFAFCHNGQRTVQSCAEGAANNDAERYETGTYYTMNDFCSVNLLGQQDAPEVPAEAENKVEA